jgi:predicted nucleic acid-binding protein
MGTAELRGGIRPRFAGLGAGTPNDRIYAMWRPNVRDEGDNFLFELALAGNANAIVTNNVRDLRATELYFPSVRVLTPEQWLRGE